MLQNPVILLPGEKLKWLHTRSNDLNADLKIDNISSNNNDVTIIDVDQKCENGIYSIGILYKENLNLRNEIEYIRDEVVAAMRNNKLK